MVDILDNVLTQALHLEEEEEDREDRDRDRDLVMRHQDNNNSSNNMSLMETSTIIMNMINTMVDMRKTMARHRPRK